ncbi:multidrug and toxin extrusion protein 1-like [Scyliorhinus canicula]|uniref:multidrug and toxin extrusion protein 1-like n=1 Tax=Scyliorhinus canicula TaxID=7830 RepID=UPI0018F6E4EC|nr:multidrug and toxin extrusion protein 1-like [Scyliorhinus canicula]
MENSKEQSFDNVVQTRGTSGNWFVRTIRRLKPVNFCQEAKRISKLAGPVFLSQLMVLLISVVSSAFCGHLGKVELGAVSLATAVITIAGISIGMGLSTACDTLISQTHGSKNMKRIGVILQRGILILSIACFPCWAIFINIKHILLAFKQSPAVAKLTQLCVKIFIPALPAVFVYDLEIRYLQNQGIIMPQVFTGLIANIINAGINYLLLFVLNLGVPGSAAANVISQYCQAILLFGYIRWKKLHVNTWPGWSTDCLQEWGHFTRLAIPSLFMLCIEWWTFYIGTFLVGIIGEVQLGAQTIIFQIISVLYMIAMGYSAAATVHVGSALGARNPEQAVNSAKVALCCMGCIALVNAALIGAVRNVVSYIFTSDKEILPLVVEVIPLCAGFHLFDAMAGVCGGVLRGAGKQTLGAIGNLVGYYLIGFPVGISLMFAAKLNVFGLWVGMFFCSFSQTVIFLIVICKINWNKAANQAQINAGMMRDMDTPNGTSSGQIKYISTEVDAVNNEMALMPNVCDLEQRLNNDQVIEEPPIVDAGVTTVGEILTTKQLIIRRGLAFLSGPLILAIGLAVHFSLENGS